MNYSQTIDYLFNKTLVFQHVGAQAYKPGLETTLELAELFRNPHNAFKAIHVAGTNGKGSTSHLLAAALQNSGFKVGLYTSPHLLDFRERIRVNGEKISEEAVIKFVEDFLASGYSGRQPSFFELTTIMAFKYFKEQEVDIAVIETGLGGRLDSTNIISPILNIITNISFDHTQFLGDTLAKIAYEKAGIIKPGIPVVIGETHPETEQVFCNKSKEQNSEIIFADQNAEVIEHQKVNDMLIMKTKSFGEITGELSGDCQVKNANTVLNAIKALNSTGLNITTDNIKSAFANVCKQTGLLGRWMKVQSSPRTFCDTGHNTGGFQYIANQLKNEKYETLRIVIGFVSDKDFTHILEKLPQNAIYYFTEASVKRALPKEVLVEYANKVGLKFSTFASVKDAFEKANADSKEDDMIYVGGSTFIVADLLEYLKNK